MDEVFLPQFSFWDDLLNVFLIVCGAKGSRRVGAGGEWVEQMRGEKARFMFRQGSALSLPHNGGHSSKRPGPQGHVVLGLGTYSISLIAGET